MANPRRPDFDAIRAEALSIAFSDRVAPAAALRAIVTARSLGKFCSLLTSFGFLAGAASFAMEGSVGASFACAMMIPLSFLALRLLVRS